jgi:hypothetical protein
MIWIAVDAMGGDEAPGHVIDGADLPSPVMPAVGADAVRLLRLVTLRTLAEAGRFERVVGAARGRPRLGI